LPGYPEGVYKDFNGDGVIELTDDLVHEVKIIVKDPKGNSSQLQFKIKKGLIVEKGTEKVEPSAFDQKEFQPGFVNVFENDDLQVILDAKALYDSVDFSHSERSSATSNVFSNVHSVLSGLVPSQTNFTIKIKPNKEVANLSDRILMKRVWKGQSEVRKAKREGDWYTAKLINFGDFYLISDDESPTI
jgi:hypothetical protein